MATRVAYLETEAIIPSFYGTFSRPASGAQTSDERLVPGAREGGGASHLYGRASRALNRREYSGARRMYDKRATSGGQWGWRLSPSMSGGSLPARAPSRKARCWP